MSFESDGDVATSGEDDHISERSENSDTEQELSDLEDAEEVQEQWLGKDGTVWSKEPARTNVRYRAENIVKIKPGVSQELRHVKDIVSCWEAFLTPAILQIIVECTNQHIEQRQININDENSKRYIMKQTNIDEIKALFGLLYLAGLFRSNKQQATDLMMARELNFFAKLCRSAAFIF